MGRQMRIAGTEQKVNKEVVDAAVEYTDKRDKRMALTKKEKLAKDALIAVMRKHELNVYRDDDADPPYVVTLTEGPDQVKVEKAKTQQEEEDGIKDLN